MKNYEEIQSLVLWLGSAAEIPHEYLKLFKNSPQTGAPHLEFSGKYYEYVIQERGFEFSRKKTENLDEFLFWIFDDLITKYSFDYELKHRIDKIDSRRLAFEKKIQIFEKVNTTWGSVVRNIIEETLKKSPHNDQI